MVRVTDHAVLRYLQRVYGVDVESIRRSIAESLNKRSVEGMIDFAGGTRCKIKMNGLIFCLKRGHVTTCYPKRMRPPAAFMLKTIGLLPSQAMRWGLALLQPQAYHLLAADGACIALLTFGTARPD